MTAPDYGATDDAELPSSARIYDYALGGTNNFPVDRLACDKVRKIFPTLRTAARNNREFMHRAARVVSDLGVRQFLDIGTGIPTEPNLHQVVHAQSPQARVVYVDNDPWVLAHVPALLSGAETGRTAYIDGDLNTPESILSTIQVRKALDLTAPVAVSLIAVLHSLSDAQDPAGVLQTLFEGLAPGSFLIASHATADFDPERMGRAFEMYRHNATYAQARCRAEFAGFFDGLELLDPGVVAVNRWRPRIEPPRWLDAEVNYWGAVARKP